LTRMASGVPATSVLQARRGVLSLLKQTGEAAGA
jgi:hypothetical protein